LDSIQDILALLGRLLCLFGGRGLCQGLICRVEILLQLIVFLLQCDELMAGVLIFPQGRDSFSYVVCIDLCDQICAHDDGVTIECRVCLLLQDEDQSGSIGSYFIFRHIKTVHDGDVFEVHSDLFQGVSFGRFGGQTDGVLSGVTVSHPVLTLSGHDSDFCQSHRRPHRQDGVQCKEADIRQGNAWESWLSESKRRSDLRHCPLRLVPCQKPNR
jgi:hypothetical protein